MSLDSTIKEINKKHGDGAIMQMGDRENREMEVIPSGNITLDLALGVGGFPRGRIVEAYGPESSGKTTLALHACAEAQKQGLKVVFIDAEHALDPTYAGNIGVNLDDLLISQPDSGEQALDIAVQLTRSGEVGLIVIDSVAALTPQAELAGDIGDSHVGLQARMMSQALRVLTAVAEKTGTTLFFINQLREKIGVMFGSPETTPGGRALKFYSSVRLDIRRIGALKNGVEIVGNETRIKVVKNKVAPPFRVAELDIMYGEGMSQEGSILDLGVEYDVLKKSGAWYYDHNGEQLGQGRDKAKSALKDNEALRDELYKLVMDAVENAR